MLRWWGSARRANDPDGVMRRIAARLTDEDRDGLAAFLGSLPPRAAGSGGGGAGELDPLRQR